MKHFHVVFFERCVFFFMRFDPFFPGHFEFFLLLGLFSEIVARKKRWNETSEFRSQRKGRKEEGRRQGGALLRLGFWSKNARFKKRSFQTAADLLAKKCSFLLGLIIGPAFFLFLRWREAEAFLEVIVPPFSLFLSPSFLPLSAVIMREKGGGRGDKKVHRCGFTKEENIKRNR